MSPLLKQHAVGNCVRRLRLDRGMSVRALASRTGFSPSFMSQVENGQVSPSISSMQRIAEALGVTLGEFFGAAAQGEAELIVRASDRLQIVSGWSGGHVEALGPMSGGRQLEPVVVTLEPGGRSGKHPHAHTAEEFAIVLEGEVRLTLGPEEHLLKTGDAATLRPGELRLWQNKGVGPARFLVVSSRFSMIDARRGGVRREARSSSRSPEKRPKPATRRRPDR